MASLLPRPLLHSLPKARSTASQQIVGLNGSERHEDVSKSNSWDPLSTRGSFGDLEDAAVLCALHRARESESRRPRLYDPYARRLVEAAESKEGSVSGKLLPVLRIDHRRWHAGIVARTNVFDQIISRFVMDQNVELVLNLAAGYDTRPYRLDLPASAQWIEVDTEHLLATKTAVLHDIRPRCVVERMPVDLTDAGARRRLLSRIDRERLKREHSGIVVTEGLLAYLHPEQVGELANDLHALRSVRWWVLDLGSPQVAAHLGNSFSRISARIPHGIDRTSRPESLPNSRPLVSMTRRLTVSGRTAIQLFSPDDGPAFFTKFGWRVIEEYTFLEEAHRLRAIAPWVWWAYQVVCRFGTASQKDLFRNMARFVVLERTDTSPTPRLGCQNHRGGYEQRRDSVSLHHSVEGRRADEPGRQSKPSILPGRLYMLADTRDRYPATNPEAHL